MIRVLQWAKLLGLLTASAFLAVLSISVWEVRTRTLYALRDVTPLLNEATLTMRNAREASISYRKSSDQTTVAMTKLNGVLDRLNQLVSDASLAVKDTDSQIVAVKEPITKILSDTDGAVVNFNTEVTAFDPGIQDFNQTMRESDAFMGSSDLPAAIHNVNLLAANGVTITGNLATTTKRLDNMATIAEKRFTQPQAFWKSFLLTALPITAEVAEIYRFAP